MVMHAVNYADSKLRSMWASFDYRLDGNLVEWWSVDEMVLKTMWLYIVTYSCMQHNDWEVCYLYRSLQ